MERPNEFLQVSEDKFLSLGLVSMTSVDRSILYFIDFFYFFPRLSARPSKKIKKIENTPANACSGNEL